MKNLRFSTVILSLVLAVLTVVSVILIKVVYSGGEKAIQHEVQLTYERDQRVLNSLMGAQFDNIRQISQGLSKSKGLQLGLSAKVTPLYAYIIDELLADISGQYIDAIVVEEKGGASTVFSNVSLLDIHLPLEQIIREHSPLAVWNSIHTQVEGKHYSLLHLPLPVVAEQTGEVIGKLHTIVLLNDNYWIANQLQKLFGSQAISLSSGETVLDGLESEPGQLQTLHSAAKDAEKGIISTENSTLRTHYLRIGNSDNFMVRSLLSNSAQLLLQDAYTTNLYYGTLLVILLGAAVMLVIRHLITSALHQVTQYAEQVPPNGSPSPFTGGRFHEFVRVGKAVEKMLLRIRERDKHLSSIIDNSPDLIFIRDVQHNFQLFNQRFIEVMNIDMKQEQLMGKPAEGILADDLTAQLREADKQVLHSRRPIQYEMEIESNIGFSTFLVSKFPIIDDQGKLRSIGGIATDITGIKQAEEQLKLAQQVFAETAEAIIVLDNELQVLSSNRAFIEMSGFAKDNITTAIHSFLEAHPDIMLQLQHTPRWQGEGALLCFDGSSLPVLVSATLLSGESDGKRYVILFSDITELKIAEQRVEKERIMLRATADMSADLIFFKDLQSRFLGCNKEFEKVVGCPEQEIRGKTDEQFFESEQALMCQEQDRQVMTENQAYCGEEYLTYSNGERHFIEMKKAPLRDKNGQVQGLIGVGRDITEHHLAQKRLKIADTAFENAKENFLVTDQKGIIISVNSASCDAFGFSKNELLGSHISILACNQRENIEAALHTQKSWHGDITYRLKNGDIHFGWLEVFVVEHLEEGISSRIYSFIDLKHSKSAEEKIQFLAKYDPLTGVFNRIALFNILEVAISKAIHREAILAVILVDINAFKGINDQYGHNAGDTVLKEVAERLKNCVLEKDTVARFGDDEFVIIIDELANEQDVAVIAQKIASQFDCKFTTAEFSAELSAKIGIAMSPDDGLDVDTLISHAEKAMQRGKEDNSTSYHFYTSELTRYSNQQFALEEELKQALQLDQFELYYRPQFDLNKRRIVAVEALLRWHHPQQGLQEPVRFLSLAESSGLAVPIGLLMLRKAAVQAVSWQKLGINFGRIVIKLSEAQISRSSFVADLQTILFETKCPNSCLEFEIDEMVFASACPAVIENLHNIGKLGIALVVGNFGEQHAIFQLIEQLRIEKIKISKHYTEGVHAHFVDEGIQNAMFVLARSLGIDVVADSLASSTEERFSSHNSSATNGRQLESKAMTAAEATFYLRCNKRK